MPMETKSVIPARLSEADVRNPHMITINVAAQLMKAVQDTMESMTVYYEVRHNIEIGRCEDPEKRLGYYTVVIHSDTTRVTHGFDIQMMLDMKDDWQVYVQRKTLSMIGQMT